MNDFKLHFTGIGAPKAGTTLVAEWLAQHPEICFAEPKEVHYFNQKSAYIHPQPNPNFAKSLSWYAQHFTNPQSKRINGEFSTGYMYDKGVAQRLFNHNPKMKIIACLRHPAKRAYSQYIMFKHYFKKETLPFHEVLLAQPEFIEKSLYFDLLKPYFDIFPKEQIKILFLDELKAEPQNQFNELCNFLEIDTKFSPKEVDKKANAAKAVKFSFISKIMATFTNIMVALGMASVVKKLKQLGIKDWVINLNSDKLTYPHMSVKSNQYILNQTIPDTEKLEQLLDKNLNHWKE